MSKHSRGFYDNLGTFLDMSEHINYLTNDEEVFRGTHYEWHLHIKEHKQAILNFINVAEETLILMKQDLEEIEKEY